MSDSVSENDTDCDAENVTAEQSTSSVSEEAVAVRTNEECSDAVSLDEEEISTDGDEYETSDDDDDDESDDEGSESSSDDGNDDANDDAEEDGSDTGSCDYLEILSTRNRFNTLTNALIVNEHINALKN